MTRNQNERGIALPIAIFALVIIGALVAGAFFIGFQEQKVGRNSVKVQQAFAAAEAGAQGQTAAWVPGAMNSMAVGSTAAFAGVLTAKSGWYRGDVRRLNGQLFLIRSEGFSADSSARQQVGMLVRLRPFQINVRAALTTQGSITVGGSSRIDGNDHVPTGWTDCGATQPPLPGITTSDSSQVKTNGGSINNYVSGSPAVKQDTSINSDTLTTFGDLKFDDLAALATKIIGAGPYNQLKPSYKADGTCNTADVNNWGDPYLAGVCKNYFPIVYSPSSTKITGGYGQGILIVNGDLAVQGGAEFYGPVIVKGAVSTQGTGGHFNGGLIAANVNLSTDVILGDALVSYSSCALSKALNNTAPAVPLQDRSWINMY